MYSGCYREAAPAERLLGTTTSLRGHCLTGVQILAWATAQAITCTSSVLHVLRRPGDRISGPAGKKPWDKPRLKTQDPPSPNLLPPILYSMRISVIKSNHSAIG